MDLPAVSSATTTTTTTTGSMSTGRRDVGVRDVSSHLAAPSLMSAASSTSAKTAAATASRLVSGSLASSSTATIATASSLLSAGSTTAASSLSSGSLLNSGLLSNTSPSLNTRQLRGATSLLGTASPSALALSCSRPRLAGPSALQQAASKPVAAAAPALALSPASLSSPSLATSTATTTASHLGSGRPLALGVARRTTARPGPQHGSAQPEVRPLPADTLAAAPSYEFVSRAGSLPHPDREGFVRLNTETHAGSEAGFNLEAVKLQFVNVMAASLIGGPDFYNRKDPTRRQIIDFAERILSYDGEFVLKVAMYTRLELNIRTTANFLLALAAHHEECRKYLKVYFGKSIRLPSDWIEVAELYQTFSDGSLNYGSLPAALRKAMSRKFTDFDEYQLGKYNKGKKKAAKGPDSGKGKGKGKGDSAKGRPAAERHVALPPISSSRSDNEEELEKMSFTLKQLIRKLHINEPVQHVMCLIGKKYPLTREEFYRSRLPGEFDAERAGRRMKLPIPETWETQVSMKGNTARTWQTLIDHRKLPFMAMLRNLRNLINAGISDKHHDILISKLQTEGSVISSRQFPFRFFSAYEVVQRLLSDSASRAGGRKIRRYLSALNSAVRIATTYNVKPIRGSTVILCDVGDHMRIPCTSARGLGKPREVLEVGILLGLMCKYSCENGDFRVFSEKMTPLSLNDESGNILDAVASVLEAITKAEGRHCPVCACELVDSWESQCNCRTCKFGCTKPEPRPAGEAFPYEYLNELLVSGIEVDNLLVLSNSSEVPARTQAFLAKYRRFVNRELLFVNVDLSGKRASVAEAGARREAHPNDVCIAGYSDAILRFVAERGERSDQLNVIEAIGIKHGAVTEAEADQSADTRPWAADSSTRSYAKKPRPAKQPQAPDVPLPAFNREVGGLRATPGPASGPAPPARKTARVFISSTFRDMHGERDLLTRYVFPELRNRAKAYGIDVYEVDLRWGLTEHDTRQQRTIQICLDEIASCDFFVGMLGDRYGWAPAEYAVPDEPRFDWLQHYPGERSMTELEFHYGALHDPARYHGRSLFLLRDAAFSDQVPIALQHEFVEESAGATAKLEALKKRVRASGLPVLDGYSAAFAGVAGGKPLAGQLEAFGDFVLESLWRSIKAQFVPKGVRKATPSNPLQVATASHEELAARLSKQFVGRDRVVKEVVKEVVGSPAGIVYLCSGPGAGKTSLMAEATRRLVARLSAANVLAHFVGSVPQSRNLLQTLRRILFELRRRFGLDLEVPLDIREGRELFQHTLKEAARRCDGGRFVLAIDAVDQFEDLYQARSLDWLPAGLPAGLTILLSTTKGESLDALRARAASGPATGQPVRELEVRGLTVLDKGTLVKSVLARYRKRLDDSAFSNQLTLLTNKKGASSPLYLAVACEELRLCGRFEDITATVEALGPGLRDLFSRAFDRLEQECGGALIAHLFRVLCATRTGLREADLKQLLADAALPEFAGLLGGGSPTVPAHSVARARRGLDPFLVVSTDGRELLSLFHEELRSAAMRRYVPGATGGAAFREAHQALARHFLALVDPRGDRSFDGRDALGYSELTHHLVAAGLWAELTSVLTSLPYIQGVCASGQGAQLIADYAADTAAPAGGRGRQHRMAHAKVCASPGVAAFGGFVSRNLHVLEKKPSLVVQQALNCPTGSAPAVAAEAHLHLAPSFFKWENKPAVPSECRRTLAGFADVVNSVAVSTMSQPALLACGFGSGVVRVFDAATGNELRALVGHSNSVSAVAFVGASALCSASWDETLRVWDLDSGRCTAKTRGHRRRVNACAADPAGKLIASASWDASLNLYDARNGKLLGTMPDNTRPLNCVDFHPEGQFVVCGNWGGQLFFWDSFNRTAPSAVQAHTKSVRSVAYSPSGRHVVSSSLDGAVKLWAATSMQEVGTFSGHSRPINDCRFSPSGLSLVTVADDWKVKLWSGFLGRAQHELGSTAAADGDASSSGEGSGNGGRDLGFVHAMSLGTGADVLAVGYHAKAVRILRASDGEEVGRLDGLHSAVTALAWDPADARLAVGCSGNELCLYTTATASKRWLEGHEAEIHAVAFSPDGARLASASGDHSVRVWATKTGREEACLDFHGNAATGVCFSPCGGFLVSVGRDRALCVWRQHKGHWVQHSVCHEAHADWINAVAVSHDGARLVTVSNDFTAKIWAFPRAKPKGGPGAEPALLHTLLGHAGALSSVSLSAEGLCATGAFDGTCKIWSPLGDEITSLHAAGRTVNAVGWAPDGRVFTGSDDGAVRSYWPFQGNPLGTLIGHADRVISTAFVGDRDDAVATSSLDGTVKLWRRDPTAAGAEAESAAEAHQAPVTAVCTAAGARHVSGDSRGGLVFWEGGVPGRTAPEAHTHAVAALCALGAEGGSASVAAEELRAWTADGHLVASAYVGFVPTCVASDGTTIVVGGWDGAVTAYDARTLELITNLVEPSPELDWVSSVALDNETATVCSSDGRVSQWDTRRESCSCQSAVDAPGFGSGWQDAWLVAACAVTPKSGGAGVVVAAASDGSLRCVEPAAGRTTAQVKAHESEVLRVVAGSGGCVFTAGRDMSIKCWELANGAWRQTGEFLTAAPCTALDVSGSSLIAGDTLGTVYHLRFHRFG